MVKRARGRELLLSKVCAVLSVSRRCYLSVWLTVLSDGAASCTRELSKAVFTVSLAGNKRLSFVFVSVVLYMAE